MTDVAVRRDESLPGEGEADERALLDRFVLTASLRA